MLSLLSASPEVLYPSVQPTSLYLLVLTLLSLSNLLSVFLYSLTKFLAYPQILSDEECTAKGQFSDPNSKQVLQKPT
jgi:hypothetical protein